jgi:hypothetical protein
VKFLATYNFACPDCGVPPGRLHEVGCDVERCPDCGRQLITCDCGRRRRRRPRLAWTGIFPGDAEAAEFGFWCRFTTGGWQPCAARHPDAQPDLNRLATACRWDAKQARWVKPGTQP